MGRWHNASHTLALLSVYKDVHNMGGRACERERERPRPLLDAVQFSLPSVVVHYEHPLRLFPVAEFHSNQVLDGPDLTEGVQKSLVHLLYTIYWFW